jgi:sugar phosphate isomerase/epimerase
MSLTIRQLSITSDFDGGTGDPAPSLQLAANAGFTHVHWCHWWTGMFMYTRREINYIRSLFRYTGLKLLDTHASDGRALWGSTYWAEAEAIIDLIENRFRFTADLNGGAIVLHAPVAPTSKEVAARFWEVMDRDLEKLTHWAKEYEVKVALEQTDTTPQNVQTLLEMLKRSDPDHIGFCWDTGHGNIHGNNRGPLKDPTADPDVHMLPFDGSVNWVEVIELLRESNYYGPLSFEVGQSQYRDRMSVTEYLALAYAKACNLDEMYRLP